LPPEVSVARWLGAVVALALMAGCGSKRDPYDGDTGGLTLPGGTGGGGGGGGGGAGGGSWSETDWCSSLGDLSAVEAGHGGTPDLRETLVALSEVRYPPAVGFIDAQDDSQLQTWFFRGSDTFEGVLDGYEIAVHEGCHIWGFGSFSFDEYSYRVVDDDRIITTKRLDNFFRSEILSRHPDPASDFYASTYLEGASGAQGFNTLLDEYNAYTHSLASKYCTRDTIAGSTSARDGILTMMWYVELYLKIAREEHPADYEAILADPAHVELILAIWDRAEYWLVITEGHPELGIDDDRIAELTYAPENLDEIGRLRGL
jgi:hypothetical protein